METTPNHRSTEPPNHQTALLVEQPEHRAKFLRLRPGLLGLHGLDVVHPAAYRVPAAQASAGAGPSALLPGGDLCMPRNAEESTRLFYYVCVYIYIYYIYIYILIYINIYGTPPPPKIDHFLCFNQTHPRICKVSGFWLPNFILHLPFCCTG